MTRIFFNASIKLVNIIVGEKNMPIRIIFGNIEDVRKEFDAVIIITATIIVFVIVIIVIIVIAVYIVVVINFLITILVFSALHSHNCL